MNKIVLDPDVLDKLNELNEGGQICDNAGQVVGFFTKLVDSSEYEIIDPPDEDELAVAERDLAGRPLADIIRDLETPQ